MFAHTQELPLPSVPGRRMLLVAGLAAASLAAALQVPSRAATGVPAAEPAAFMDVDERPSHHGRYRAAVVAPPEPAVGAAQAWTIRLERADRGPVSGATLAVVAHMPEEGGATPAPVTVHEEGNGRYRLEPLRFSRPGWWNVALVVRADAGVDSVAFNVLVPR